MNISMIIVLSAYFAILVGTALYANRRINTVSDYILGGRTLNGPIAALGVGAADMGSWLMLALPGAIYVLGTQQLWMPLGLVIGAWFNWTFVSKRLRIYTELANDAQTLPEYLDHRFADKQQRIRIVTALIILVFFSVYAAAGFVGLAFLLEASFDIEYHQALVVAAAVVAIYACIGGFLAVNWVDFFQGTLMLFALILVPLITWQHVDLTTTTPEITKLLSFDWSIVAILSGLAWGLGYFGQPHILSRFMAISSIRELKKARVIAMTWMVLCLAGAIGIGLLGAVFFQDQPLKNPETIFISLAKFLFHPWVFAILFAAVVSAIISTASAQLLASASSLTEDFYKTFLRPQAKQKELVILARIFVFCVTVAALGIAYNPDSKVLSLVTLAWAGMAAAFGPMILFSLYWPRMNRQGAIAGLVSGALSVIAWRLLEQYTSYSIFEIYAILPGFICSSLVIILFSLNTAKPEAKIYEEFKRMQKLIVIS